MTTALFFHVNHTGIRWEMNVQPDEVWWKPEKSGKYSVKGFYFAIQENNSMLGSISSFSRKHR